MVFEDEEVLIISEQGMIIRVPVSGISSIGRNTQGVRVVRLEESDNVVAAMKLVDKEQTEENDGAEESPEDEPVH